VCGLATEHREDDGTRSGKDLANSLTRSPDPRRGVRVDLAAPVAEDFREIPDEVGRQVPDECPARVEAREPEGAPAAACGEFQQWRPDEAPLVGAAAAALWGTKRTRPDAATAAASERLLE